MRGAALVLLVWAGCSSSASGMHGDGCLDCDLAGGGGPGATGGNCTADCDMAGGGGGDGGVVDTCGGDPTCVFAPPRAYRRGRNAFAVAAAKLNSDAYPDLVVSHTYDISVRLGAAGNAFLPETVYDAGAYPHQFAFADFDGDGRNDIAVSSGNGKQVAVLTAVGDGVFTVQPPMMLASAPVGVAAGDLDHNGRADLVVLLQDPDQLLVYLDSGNGSFAPPVTVALAQKLNAVSVVDFDGDGKLDIVAVGTELQFFAGKGDGTLEPEVRVTLPMRADLLAVGDFNNDNAPDLALGGMYPGPGTTVEAELGMVLNNGTGGVASVTHVAFGNPEILSLIPARIDAGSNLDLVVVREAGGSLAFAPGNGDGTFGATVEQAHDLDAQTSSLSGAAVADFDQDGKADVAIASFAGWAATLAGRGDGHFDPAWYGNVAYGRVALADVDGNGKKDLILASWYPTLVTRLGGGAGGAFDTPVDERVAKGASVMAAGDFDGDGKADVVTGSPQGMSIRWGRDGTFVALAALATYSAVELASADMNGDGLDDLVIGGTGEVRVYLGGANHTLTAATPWMLGVSRPVAPLVIADFDGDGTLDCAYGTFGAPGLAVLIGKRDGTFARAVASAADLRPTSMAPGDYDGNGTLDLAITVEPTTVQLLLGDNKGGFTKGDSYTTASRAFLVLGGDFDGDGKRDLVLGRGGDFNASFDVWRGDGAGHLTLLREHKRGYLPIQGVVGDFDGDGKSDVAIVDFDGASVFLNRFGR
ncbi:MAG: putative aggregation factor core protein MAFp3, isoform [Myxococcales bacterium]|nr:putative aggregation factor core protein MAFp3, isoform [Myxococcales bacterium]